MKGVFISLDLLTNNFIIFCNNDDKTDKDFT